MWQTIARYAVCTLGGLVGGAFGAWSLVSSGLFNGDPIGPWTTGVDYGSADASALTRAAVALHGILALPASEARYFEADTDSAGRPLSGDCTYRISGSDLAGAWWSITAYNSDGFLIENPARRYSVPNRLASPNGGDWSITVSADDTGSLRLPVARGEPFSLVLRLYVSEDAANPRLPSIERRECVT
ncbi:DUF1214 domain-containing protein [Erythrobacter sp.]|uniref:DUF1214 domain-containing protein n=1 Tax=Erythrobacter sp. TaxID=1042 RepID=UPI002EA061EE|nr:DUF1214 domain-containing protein [Erythrobacter sp.]